MVGKTLVLGANGFVGSHLVSGFDTARVRVLAPSSKELDLRDLNSTRDYLEKESPETVVMAAAKVAGIRGNSSNNLGFLMENLIIHQNTIQACLDADIKRLFMLSSACMYSENSSGYENDYLSDSPHPTNVGYALAKRAATLAVDMAYHERQKNWITVIPTNLYGSGDKNDDHSSHLIPAIVRRAVTSDLHGLKEFEVFGNGAPMRDFLHIQDLVAAMLTLLRINDLPDKINVSTGTQTSIREVADIIGELTHTRPIFTLSELYPQGVLARGVMNDRIRSTGWSPKITLGDGLREMISQEYKSRAV